MDAASYSTVKSRSTVVTDGDSALALAEVVLTVRPLRLTPALPRGRVPESVTSENEGAPCGPVGPWGSGRALCSGRADRSGGSGRAHGSRCTGRELARAKSVALRLRSLTSTEVTAPILSWALPTLLRGSVAAAYDVPPSATTRASRALLSVLLTLLTPCIDYVIVFSGLAGGDSQRLVAAAPLLMLAQMLALPVLLWLFAGPELADTVEVGPFLEAFGILIVLPLSLAWATEALAARHRAGGLVPRWSPRPRQLQ